MECNVSTVTLKVFFLIVCCISYATSDTESANVPNNNADIAVESNQTVIAGTTLEFDCTLNNTNYNGSVIWKRIIRVAGENTSTQELRNLQDSRISFLNDSSTNIYSVRIEKINLNDSGIYTCDTESHNYTRRIRFIVYGPVFFYPNTTSSNITVDRNGKVMLKCYAGGDPIPTVFFKLPNNSVIFSSNSTNSDILKIANITKKDAGKYSCVASNSFSNKSTDYLVTVQYAPVIRNCTFKVIYYPHHMSILECHVESYVVPEISWYKDDQKLQLNENVTNFRANVESLPDDLHNVTLVVNDGSGNTRQYGHYTLRVQNAFGQDKIIVASLPNLPVISDTCEKSGCTFWIIVCGIFFAGLIIYLTYGRCNVINQICTKRR